VGRQTETTPRPISIAVQIWQGMSVPVEKRGELGGFGGKWVGRGIGMKGWGWGPYSWDRFG